MGIEALFPWPRVNFKCLTRLDRLIKCTMMYLYVQNEIWVYYINYHFLLTFSHIDFYDF